MKKIGIIAPYEKRINKISKFNIFKKNKPDFIFNEKHRICFVVAYDNQSYNKIFKKNGVLAVVIADGTKLKKESEFKIYDGQSFYNKYLIYFIIKAFKFNALNSETASLAIVFDKYNKEIYSLAIQASKLFRYIFFVTDDTEAASQAATSIIDNYGITITVKNQKEDIDTTMAVELTKSTIKYNKEIIVINIDSNIIPPKDYNISMQNNVKFKVRKLALAEALFIIEQNN